MALRTGITTGTCAAAAARAAAQVLFGGEQPAEVSVPLPSGQRLTVPVLYTRLIDSGRKATAAVRKDAGDDPDVTDGLEVVATVWRSVVPGVQFLAGDGVGTVTKPGLQVPPGEPAINPVPRRMIQAAVREAADGGLCVELAVPGGREVAARTFNPRLGIVGGLSILGTTGILRPYCTKALHDALKCALDVASACQVTAPVLVPGNIGAAAANRHFALRWEQLIEVGNEWGFVLGRLADHAFTAALLLGHPGKLAKLPMLAPGDWNTHSSRSGSATQCVADLFAAVLHRPAPASPTVEGLFAALALGERRVLGDVLAERIAAAVRARIGGTMAVAAFLVDMAGDCLGTDGDLAPWRPVQPES